MVLTYFSLGQSYFGITLVIENCGVVKKCGLKVVAKELWLKIASVSVAVIYFCYESCCDILLL
ncbi:hypothetical protein SCA6_002054 [Theobroma cacao]